MIRLSWDNKLADVLTGNIVDGEKNRRLKVGNKEFIIEVPRDHLLMHYIPNCNVPWEKTYHVYLPSITRDLSSCAVKTENGNSPKVSQCSQERHIAKPDFDVTGSPLAVSFVLEESTYNDDESSDAAVQNNSKNFTPLSLVDAQSLLGSYVRTMLRGQLDINICYPMWINCSNPSKLKQTLFENVDIIGVSFQDVVDNKTGKSFIAVTSLQVTTVKNQEVAKIDPLVTFARERHLAKENERTVKEECAAQFVLVETHAGSKLTLQVSWPGGPAGPAPKALKLPLSLTHGEHEKDLLASVTRGDPDLSTAGAWKELNMAKALVRYASGRGEWPVSSNYAGADLAALCHDMLVRSRREAVAADITLSLPPARDRLDLPDHNHFLIQRRREDAENDDVTDRLWNIFKVADTEASLVNAVAAIIAYVTDPTDGGQGASGEGTAEFTLDEDNDTLLARCLRTDFSSNVLFGTPELAAKKVALTWFIDLTLRRTYVKLYHWLCLPGVLTEEEMSACSLEHTASTGFWSSNVSDARYLSKLETCLAAQSRLLHQASYLSVICDVVDLSANEAKHLMLEIMEKSGGDDPLPAGTLDGGEEGGAVGDKEELVLSSVADQVQGGLSMDADWFSYSFWREGPSTTPPTWDTFRQAVLRPSSDASLCSSSVITEKVAFEKATGRKITQYINL